MNYRLPRLATIFCGVDTTGQHIYVTHDSDVGCYDAIGFASIGIGARHANSQFMFQGHTPRSPLAETLLLTYIAKKRAEVAPGVGSETDIFLIGPTLGSYTSSLNDELIKKLAGVYANILKRERKEQDRAKLEMSSYVGKSKQTRRRRQPRQPSNKAQTIPAQAPELSFRNSPPILDANFQSVLIKGHRSLLRRLVDERAWFVGLPKDN